MLVFSISSLWYVFMQDFDYLSKIKWEVVVVDESQQFKTAKSHRAFLQFDAGFWLLYISELSKVVILAGFTSFFLVILVFL